MAISIYTNWQFVEVFKGAPQTYHVARINDPQSRLPAQASLLFGDPRRNVIPMKETFIFDPGRFRDVTAVPDRLSLMIE